MLWLEEHVSRCDSCRAEAVFLERLLSSRREAPAGLAAAVMARLEDATVSMPSRVPDAPGSIPNRPHLPPRRFGGWAVSVAAVLVLALGIGTFWMAESNVAGDLFLSAFLEDGDEPGNQDEWMVAGAPVLDALPDEVLLALVTEGAW
ncbi:MAG: hypothetical protein EA422_08255 [Gemmatimonadales bacterium]|nr:MAG: hypothetical protein EA422_08255 [Gemmatimonadales bacterium]